jgi:hypothetical protein
LGFLSRVRETEAELPIIPLGVNTDARTSFIYLFFWLGFELRALRLQSKSHTSSPFCSGYFGDEVSRTICPEWPQTAILLISASQVAGITGANHRARLHPSIAGAQRCPRGAGHCVSVAAARSLRGPLPWVAHSSEARTGPRLPVLHGETGSPHTGVDSSAPQPAGGALRCTGVGKRLESGPPQAQAQRPSPARACRSRDRTGGCEEPCPSADVLWTPGLGGDARADRTQRRPLPFFPDPPPGPSPGQRFGRARQGL